MPIIKWEPLSELDHMFEDRFFPSISFPSLSSKFGWDLAVDLYEEGGNVIAKMNLPGIKPDELDITVDEDVLTVSGSREDEKEIDVKNYYSKEIRRGEFSRSVRLPKSVDADKVQAGYSDGVLEIRMPVVKGKEEKAVHVKVAKN